MGYSVYDQGGHNTAPYVATLIADATTDLENIPKDVYAPGTAVLVMANSSVYMLNTAKTDWIQLGSQESPTPETSVEVEEEVPQ